MTDIEYATERARNLSRELMLREENALTKADGDLCADALTSYADALFKRREAKDLGDMERVIVGGHADELAHDMRDGGGGILGPTDSELCSRALKFYSRELAGKLRTALAVAA